LACLNPAPEARRQLRNALDLSPLADRHVGDAELLSRLCRGLAPDKLRQLIPSSDHARWRKRRIAQPECGDSRTLRRGHFSTSRRRVHRARVDDERREEGIPMTEKLSDRMPNLAAAAGQ